MTVGCTSCVRIEIWCINYYLPVRDFLPITRVHLLHEKHLDACFVYFLKEVTSVTVVVVGDSYLDYLISCAS